MTDLEEFRWVPRDTEFAEARAALHDHPGRQVALASARVALEAEGDHLPQFRDVMVRAAAIIREQANY